MKELLCCEDLILLRLLCAELAGRGIEHRLEGEAVNALIPVGDLLAPRVLVDEADYAAAERVLSDLLQGRDPDPATLEDG